MVVGVSEITDLLAHNRLPLQREYLSNREKYFIFMWKQLNASGGQLFSIMYLNLNYFN